MADNYILLERTELNATAASVTFANIPQTGYTDLKVVMSVRDTYAAVSAALFVGFNGGTASLSSKYIQGSGSSAVSGNLTSVALAGLNTGANATASTFSNIELYIPNYTSSNYKSYSADSVTENNATEAYTNLIAGLWSNTAAITSMTFTCGTAFTANSTFSLYGLAALGTTPAIAPKADGGNRIDNDGTYWYHTFTSSGSFVPQTGLTADVLVVAGGGGGSYYHGSGAGAGGLLTFTSQALTSTTYSCTVGAGGSGTTAGSANTGSDSQFGALTLVKGGGGGQVYDTGNGINGGSGSGATSSSTNRTGGSPTSGQGFAGGDVTGGLTGFYPNAGGGGAGAVGGSITSGSQAGGSGGIGLTNATLNAFGVATTTGQLSSGNYSYAVGGGACSYGGGGTGAGGLGGGGAGSAGTGTAGTVNTGGGGGAGGSINPANLGGAGGSGIIIIRYPIA